MHFVLIAQLLAMQAPPPVAATAIDLPFAAGEVLEYEARAAVIGRIGEATMRVDGPCTVDGRAALQLSFDVSGRAAFLRVSDATRSWIDITTLATLRYEKRESSPLGSHQETVTLLADQRRWQDGDGIMFDVGSSLPVDELSLIYYLRTLKLSDGDSDLGAGHFDARRNPISLRVIGRTVTEVPAGRFDVIELELKVRDPRRYRGTGTIHIQMTDDERRIPVRIRTSLPGTSAVTLVLRVDPGTRDEPVVREPVVRDEPVMRNEREASVAAPDSGTDQFSAGCP